MCVQYGETNPHSACFAVLLVLNRELYERGIDESIELDWHTVNRLTNRLCVVTRVLVLSMILGNPEKLKTRTTSSINRTLQLSSYIWDKKPARTKYHVKKTTHINDKYLMLAQKHAKTNTNYTAGTYLLATRYYSLFLPGHKAHQ